MPYFFKESAQELGYKLLVYISCCFAGRAYSVGNIPDELVKPVREQVYITRNMLITK